MIESGKVTAAYFERRVNKQIGHVAVACENTCHETAETRSIADKILIGVDQANLIIDVVAELGTLLQADHISLGGGERLIGFINESFGFSGTLNADTKFNHSCVLPFSLYLLRRLCGDA